MPSPAPPEFASLAGLNGALRAGRIRARDMVRAAMRALEPETKPGGLVRELLGEEALRTARDVERELGRGRTRGLLQGAPFAVSEMIALSGRRPPWNPGADPRRVEDAAAVSRLRGAKAMPLALAASPPFGGLVAGRAAVESGCAALVARRLLPFALAVDFNGNALRGALAQGCCALRPTFGLVSAFGLAPLGWSLATAAVLAANAEDCGTVLARISGGDARSPHSPGRAFHYAPQYARGPEQIRAAVAPGGEALSAALRNLRAPLVEFPAPDLPAGALVETILAAEAGEALADLLPGQPEGRAWMEEAQSLAAFDYLHAMRLRRMVQEWFSAAAERVDVLVLSPDGHEHPPVAAEPEGADGSCLICEALFVAVLAGAPVYASAGLGAPRFIAIGRPGAENTLLRLASALESLPGSGGAPGV